jgi:hypothetical protein
MTLLAGADAGAQSCAPDLPVTAAQRARRGAAVEFLGAVNAAESRAHAAGDRYAALADLPGLPAAPVGFVPRLTFDQWSYAVSVKDLFDACGFALFTDSEGTIYEAHAASAPDTPGESDSGGAPALTDAARVDRAR